MASPTRNPKTPQRNQHSLVSAWLRTQRPLVSPGRPPPRRIVIPASPPPNTPTTTDRPRRLSVEPTLPPNVPTEPAAMRRAPEYRQPQQYVPSPRRRVVPNILPEEEPPSYSQTKPEYKPDFKNYIPPLQPCVPVASISNANVVKAAEQAKQKRYPGGRYINTNFYKFNSQGPPTIIRTGLDNYPRTQQAADYAELMSGSVPEETWETRRKAPMVPAARDWIEADVFALQYFNAIVTSYKQDAASGAKLGGTNEERERESRRRLAGHETGVSVDLEVKRHKFEAELLKRAREMIMRDNGIMPRGALNRPAMEWDPQPWCDSLNSMRPEKK